MKTSQKSLSLLALCFSAPALFACGTDSAVEGSGNVTVLLEPESTIKDGLKAGEEAEDIHDGWTVTFDKYLLGVGHIHSHLSTDNDVEVEADQAYIVDLKKVRSQGETLWELEDLPTGRWTFGYEFVGGGHGPQRFDGVNADDYERMQDEDLTYMITGTLTKEGGVSCPPTSSLVEPEAESTGENAAGDKCYPNTSIAFEFAVAAETVIDNCQQDGLPGFTIADKRTSTVAITVHGDHLFFNGFPEGGEGGITRLAQIWADADLNLDGKISTAEHKDVLLADMAEWDDTYQKGGAPLDSLETLGDLARGQLKTQGHMDGEGECAADGHEHEHGEAHEHEDE